MASTKPLKVFKRGAMVNVNGEAQMCISVRLLALIGATSHIRKEKDRLIPSF